MLVLVEILMVQTSVQAMINDTQNLCTRLLSKPPAAKSGKHSISLYHTFFIFGKALISAEPGLG